MPSDNIYRSGYSDGFIYLDTVKGVPGTESFVNGTPSNPVNNLRDAKLLSARLGLSIRAPEPDHPLVKAVREATKEKDNVLR